MQLQVLSTADKVYDDEKVSIIKEGFLFAAGTDWFYPIIAGVPRLNLEAFLDYESFCRIHLPGYDTRKQRLLLDYGGLIKYVQKKNRRSRQSFAQEWSVFDYDADKTWDASANEILNRFLKETDETSTSLKGKLIFDAGCGNGLLNQFIAKEGAVVLGMDFSQSVERAFEKNSYRNALFIQGDVQFPPLAFGHFDIVHSSGVLICTNNTELSFSCIEPCVKTGGKLSTWLYHPRKNFIHNLFNFIRRFTSKLPVKMQYWLYLITLLPVSFIVKRVKGNKQNTREMMVDILDWFSPEFRWEHTHDEAASWFSKRNYRDVKITTDDLFGFNIIAVKG
jgi:SAM-dependent methyltransferase